LVSLLYHKPLDEAWVDAIGELRNEFVEKDYKLDFIGRARKQKYVVERDYVTETMRVKGREFLYRQVENSFTQPNGKVAERMLEWAQESTCKSTGDLLELYCGNGNFSIALAQNFQKVLATELAKPSVEAAHWNIEANGISNVKIARLSAEELTEAMQGVREFTRLKQQEINLQSYDFSTVLVDPPRAGMDEASVRMIQVFDTILYISCNPETLERNLNQLAATHGVESMAMFDQFPYTKHREIGVVLRRQ
jgi:tRNA (uracil-5-)-methyltransferase